MRLTLNCDLFFLRCVLNKWKEIRQADGFCPDRVSGVERGKKSASRLVDAAAARHRSATYGKRVAGGLSYSSRPRRAVRRRQLSIFGQAGERRTEGEMGAAAGGEAGSRRGITRARERSGRILSSSSPPKASPHSLSQSVVI